MPFDNTREHPHQRLLDLEEKLRKRDFPFEWDFGKFSHCAAAIDCKANANEFPPTYKYLAEYYGITLEESKGIFSSAWHFYEVGPFANITPEIVANTIRKVLEEKVYAYAPR